MELLEQVQVEIEKRSLYDGGWASGKSRKAGIETTCYALMALHNRPSIVLDRGTDLLFRTQNPDGSWSAFEGDDPEGCWTTALATIFVSHGRRLHHPKSHSTGLSITKAARVTGFGNEIPNSGSCSAVQPGKVRMVVISGHCQLDHSDSSFTHRA